MKQLIKKLNILEYTYIRDWRTVMKVVSYISQEKEDIKIKIIQSQIDYPDISDVVVLEKEWSDDFKNKHDDLYPLDLGDIKNWSTFDDREYISLKFYIESEVLYCRFIIKDRINGLIQLPIIFLKEITSYITGSYNIHIEDMYEEHLELIEYNKKQKWIEETNLELLSDG